MKPGQYSLNNMASIKRFYLKILATVKSKRESNNDLAATA
jgi:hypothetical protein